MAEGREGFLSRWSKLKQANQEKEPVEIEPVAPTGEELQAEELRLEAEREEAEANRLAAEAVDLDKIEYGFDFSIFLKRGVPDVLRKKALRKFYRSNPVLANLDGLNDYDEDYNNPLHKVYKSTWDVARGFLSENEKLLQQATGRLTEEGDAASTASEDQTEEVAEAELVAGDGAATDGQSDTDAREVSPEEADGDDADTIAEQASEPVQQTQKRVSIRQRLNG